MRRALVIVASTAALLSSAVCAADDTCAPEPHVQCLKQVTIYGRAPKPMVVIELRHAAAASAAGQAHAAMRERWTKAPIPVTL